MDKVQKPSNSEYFFPVGFWAGHHTVAMCMPQPGMLNLFAVWCKLCIKGYYLNDVVSLGI
jgi:hypothetical protein